MGTQPDRNDDMPAEIDFSKGIRGKFFKSSTTLKLPVYLDAEVEAQRDNTIRIIGAGYWRKGRRAYERENG